jgi:hypothetical protein
MAYFMEFPIPPFLGHCGTEPYGHAEHFAAVFTLLWYRNIVYTLHILQRVVGVVSTHFSYPQICEHEHNGASTRLCV